MILVSHEDLRFLGPDGCLQWLERAATGEPGWPPYERDVNWWLHAMEGVDAWVRFDHEDEWLPVVIAILERLPELAAVPEEDLVHDARSAMLRRIERIKIEGSMAGDHVRDPQIVLDWVLAGLPDDLAAAKEECARVNEAMEHLPPASENERLLAKAAGHPEPSGQTPDWVKEANKRWMSIAARLDVASALEDVNEVTVPQGIQRWIDAFRSV